VSMSGLVYSPFTKLDPSYLAALLLPIILSTLSAD
jgi:hypothetical protein